MKAKRLSKAQWLSLDRITALPQPIIETILYLLRTEEAARTSILSKEWRYKWTTIPKLEFDVCTTSELCAIHQVLLRRQDPIHEFILSLDGSEDGDCTRSDIHKILLYLSRNHPLKTLKLKLNVDSSCNLPLTICNGFGSLTSLSLEWVPMYSEALYHFLSNCPSLKSFSLFMIGENMLGDKRPTMVELFECLPVIERLNIFGDTAMFLVPDLVPQELPTSLIHLKYICLEQINFVDGYGLTFLAVLIKYSPNLEKIEIGLESESIAYDETETDILEEYSDVWLEHLMEVKIKNYNNMKAELEFLRFILAKSPKLKKVSILSHFVEKNEESEMFKTLLRTQRASPVVIDFVSKRW